MRKGLISQEVVDALLEFTRPVLGASLGDVTVPTDRQPHLGPRAHYRYAVAPRHGDTERVRLDSAIGEQPPVHRQRCELAWHWLGCDADLV